MRESRKPPFFSRGPPTEMSGDLFFLCSVDGLTSKRVDEEFLECNEKTSWLLGLQVDGRQVNRLIAWLAITITWKLQVSSLWAAKVWWFKAAVYQESVYTYICYLYSFFSLLLSLMLSFSLLWTVFMDSIFYFNDYWCLLLQKTFICHH